MKKILLSVCALLAVSVIFAQSNLVNLPSDNLQKGYTTMSTVPNPTPSTAVLQFSFCKCVKIIKNN